MNFKPIDISIIITTFNDGYYLNQVLKDISCLEYNPNKLEILILEAGEFSADQARTLLGNYKDRLKFWHKSNLSRTAALNFLVKESIGNLVVRIDARSHIKPDYLNQIKSLSLGTKAANVGGVILPIGVSNEQKKIARFMLHPLAFGGAKFRKLSYVGEVDSVYLGAFNKLLMPPQPWFDELHSKISEDSDLNFRIRRDGQKIIVDSSIIVEHYPRETAKSFFKLCYNYGLGRGLFFLKNKQFSAVRQLFFPLAFLIALFLFCVGFFIPIFHLYLAAGSLIYLLIILTSAYNLSSNLLRDIFFYLKLFAGCHFFWTLGFFISPIPFFTSLIRKKIK
jgi:succinoglycan biosynthesis protein ExoA